MGTESDWTYFKEFLIIIIIIIIFKKSYLAKTVTLGVSRWSPFLKSIRVFSVVGLAVNSDE